MSQNELKRGLKQRHITMIAIGGVIGAGLFLGGGKAVFTNGPVTIVSYLVAAVIVVLVMRMLGEMASVRLDVTGSFMAYALEAFGSIAGYTIGWLYYFFWMYIIALESTFGAQILNELLPNVFPSNLLWLISLVLTILLTITNLITVKAYGEFEFWFACIKVTTIVIFLILGTLIMIGLIPSVESPGLTNFLNKDNGGFMPHGWSSVFLGILFIMFAFFGAEIGAIAVRESDNPEKAIHTVVNSVVWRILLFYIGSILFIILIIPSNDQANLLNPYASIFDMAGIPYASTIVKLVVLTSVLSCLNSALYTNSRMLFAMANDGNAPKFFSKLSKKGVPVRAVLASTTFAYIAAIIKLVSTEDIDLFQYIANAAGAVALLVYLIIALSQIRLRYRNKDMNYPIKMWLFPYLSYAVVAIMVSTLCFMIFVKDVQWELLSTLILALFIVVTYFISRRNKNENASELNEK